MNQITIARIGSHRTVKFAAEELCRYLKRMDPAVLITVGVYETYDSGKENVLWVGADAGTKGKLPKVEDPKLDDAIWIQVKDFCGVLSGNHERSVLMAVYRFLKELGARWLHPGPTGEVIPNRTLDVCSISVCEAADMRYRVVCIEGAVGYEHAYHMIDWLPKAGMNGYFIQFERPTFFLKRWYSHEQNEGLGAIELESRDVDAIHRRMTEDILERSLVYQAVGHGWTCEPFGIASELRGEEALKTISDDVRKMLALRNGKRTLFGGAPANTQFCMSNPEAVKIVSTSVAKYCKAHPEITEVHVWLADMRNNFCECENCRGRRPADLYVELMNQIDEKLTEGSVETKIIMISYNDLSWAPLERQLKNPKRFVLMFAPITRSFRDSFGKVDMASLPQEPPFVLNQLEMPRTNPPIISLMKGWDDFAVDGRCVFDYHLWTTRVECDLGGFSISRILSEDIKSYEGLKLNGLVSCQPQRCSFPNHLPMQVMAQTLWDTSAEFERIVEDYYTACYGKEWKTARDYLEALSSLVTYWPAYNEADVIVDAEREKKAKEALVHVAAYRPLIASIAAGVHENEVQKRQWSFLLIHTELAELSLRLQARKFAGESAAERADAIKALREKYRELEPELHEVLDVWRELKGYSE